MGDCELVDERVFWCVGDFYLTNSLLKYLSSKIFYLLLVCVCNHLYIGKNKFVIFNYLVSKQTWWSSNPKIIWSLNFFLLTFGSFINFDFLFFLYFNFFKKSNINVYLKNTLTTEHIESKYFILNSLKQTLKMT
jgi:hypothetical protein